MSKPSGASFFSSPSAMVAFALLRTDRDLRKDLLEIKKHYYHSRVAAENWHSHLVDILNESPLSPNIIVAALDELERIYNKMIEPKR